MPSGRRSSEPVVTAGATDGDDRLGATRRVDWRFLLDHPVLDTVLTAGRPDPALIAGLNAVARSVRPVSSASGAAGDLVVVAGPISDQAFATAAAAVRPGGWVAVEADGILGRSRRPFAPSRVRQTARTVRTLRANGFEAVEAHLALPRREAATALVPLDGTGGLAMWLSRSRGRKGRLARLVGRIVPLVIRSGVVMALAPGSVVIGRRRRAEPIANAAPAGWIRARLAAVDPELLGELDAAVVDILVLTPRYEASAHIVALALEPVGSSIGPRFIVKAARLGRGADTLAREGQALLRLGSTLGATGHAPRVLVLDAGGSPPYLIETGVVGTPLDPTTVRRDRAAASAAIAVFVARLPTTAGPDAREAMAGSRLGQAALEVLEHAGIAPDLIARSRSRIAALAHAPLPAAFEHGDLAHPNLVVRPDGTLAAVDWERAEPDGLPLHDLTMALAYTAAAAAGATAPDEQAAAFVVALSGDDPWAARILDAELDRLGIHHGLRGVLTVVPWIRTAAFLAERTRVAWLGSDRSVALWRAMLDMADRDDDREPPS